MLRFLRIERPTTVILRPHSIATSAACCMRWMFDANEATRMRPVRSGKSVRNVSPDEPLGARRAGALGVRRVAEEEVDPAIPDLGELADVGPAPVHRRVVELPVARVHDAPGLRVDDERDGVRDRVRDTDELDAERAELERVVVGRRLDQLGRLAEPVLVELRLDERERQPRRDDGVDVHLAQEVRQPADVVLVAVREHDGAHALALEVRDVRQKQVDAEVLVAREREPGVDDDASRPRSRRRSCSSRPRRGRRAG